MVSRNKHFTAHLNTRHGARRDPNGNRLECDAGESTNTSDAVVRIVAFGRDEKNARYVLVHAPVGGEVRRKVIALSELDRSGGVLAGELGILTQEARRKLLSEIEVRNRLMPDRFIVATRPGLFKNSFTLPNGRVLCGRARMYVRLPDNYQEIAGHRYAEARDDDAERLLELATGNLRIMLVIAVALCGPVLELLRDVELPMVQLVGPREAGKSTLLRVASSVWMRPGPLHTWSDTVNSLEAAAAAASGTLITIDELGAFDWGARGSFKNLRTAVMRLFEGSMRGRMTQASSSWRLALLSSTNLAVHELAAEAGARWDDEFLAAMRSRLIDIPLQGLNGAFEDLHGYGTVQQFVAELRGIIERNYGWCGRLFVVRMLRWRQRYDDLGKGWLTERREAYIAAAAKRWGDEFARVHQVFATIYAAGRLAIELDVLPWEKRDFGLAILSCEEAHVALVRTASFAPQCEDPLEPIKRLIREDRGTIRDLRNGLIVDCYVSEHRACNGYILVGPRGRLEYFVSDERLTDLCGGSARAAALKQHLKRICTDFGDEHRHSVRRTIDASGRRAQGIAIPATVLGFE